MSINPLDVRWVPHAAPRGSQALALAGVNAVCNASAHTKGNWAQQYTATLEDTYMVRVYVDSLSVSTADTSTLVDIGVGALGVETVVVANLLCGYWSPSIMAAGPASPTPHYYDIPLFIPKGTRISTRAQSVIGSEIVPVIVELYGASSLLGEPITGHAIDTMGALTASSHGTAVVCAVNGGVGTWTALSTATAAAYKMLLIGVDGGANTLPGTILSTNVTFDIGVGASGSEQLILPADYVQVSTRTDESVNMRCPSNHLLALRQPIPAGSRLSVRASQSASGAQTLGVALYGVR